MTEKQIQELKKMLNGSVYADNSKELDDKILNAARAREPKLKPSIINSWQKFLPLSFMRTATLAIALTVCSFFGMSHMISIDEPVQFSSKDESIFDGQRTVGELAQASDDAQIDMPGNIAIGPAPTSLSRDKILMDFDLPSTSVLVAKMDFEFDDQRASAQQNISVAMNDIRALIEIGELDNARQRYAKLKQMCSACALPDTLEALVLNNLAVPSSTG